jgi:glucose-induced degradation protein 4
VIASVRSLAPGPIRCLLSSFLNPPPMPTNNRPTSIAEVISTRTCPPELDRTSAWRDSPDSTVSASEALEDALTPASMTVPSVLSRSDDGTALLTADPLKVESKIPGATDDETSRERSSSPTESCARTRSPVMPPNSSLLRYEFSNVRVSLTAQHRLSPPRNHAQ